VSAPAEAPDPARALGRLAACNALLQVVAFWRALGRFLTEHQRYVPAPERALLLVYAAATYATLALLFWGACRLLARVLPPRPLRAGALIVLTVGCVLLYLDRRVFGLLGVHVYSASVREALENARFNREVHLDRAAALLVAGGTAGVLVLQGLALWAVQRWAWPWSRRLGVAGLVALAAAWAVAIAGWPTIASFSAPDGVANLLPWQGLLRRRGPAMRASPRYPGAAQVPRLRRTPTILFITVESFRADVVGEELTPNIERFARAQRCLRPRHHFSSSHVTELGTFSLLYGLHAYHFGPFSQSGVSSFPLHILRSNGYRLAGASSSDLAKWLQAGFIVRQLSPYQEWGEIERGDQRDARLVEWARRYHQEIGRLGPSFLFLFFDATHVDYAYPPEFERDRPVLEDNWVRRLGAGPVASLVTPIRNRYRNSVRYVDHLFGQLMDEYRGELARGELIVVLTGDHGEAFWEHGLWGHLGAPGDPAATEVPLLLCLPGVEPVAVEVSGHVDIFPTLLDYLAAPATPSFAAFSSGRSLLAPGDPCAVITPKSFPRESHQLYLMTPGRQSTIDVTGPPFQLQLAGEHTAVVDRCLQRLSVHFDDFLGR
jgi:membrane-anchored protein YejM (alkaline phosphatase superfamily)